MKKRLFGLTGKLTAGIILLGILLGSIASFVGYREFTSVLEQQYNDSAYEVAETARSYLDADKLLEYLETGETDAAYSEIERRLDQLVVTSNVTLIYVAWVDPTDYRTLTYIYDSVHPSTGFDRYPLGYVATDIDDQYLHTVKSALTTGKRATEYLYSYSEESGAHTTAGASVYNSAGDIIAILGVEKAMTALDNARTTYVEHVVEFTAIAMLTFLALYILFLHRDMIQPLLSITNEAKRFADTHEKTSRSLAAIKKRDEIGTLAGAIQKMELDINTYIQDLTTVTAEKERIGAELDVAKHIQASMLPCIFPAFPERPELDIHATMTPAKEVGGDFYDFFLIDDNHLAMVMADVSGKGVPAALFMVIAKTLLKNVTQTGLSPKDVLEKVNNQLCEGNEAEMFVTVWLGILEISTGKMTCANAGHEYPVVRLADGDYELIKDKHGFVLAGMENAKYKEYELTLKTGDKFFLYTDGVAEATDAHDQLYGTDRMLVALNQNKDAASDELLIQMQKDIDLFVGEAPQFDDITMLTLTIKEGMQ